MKPRHISFGSIEQFRGVLQSVSRKAQFVKFDEETGEAVMNYNAPLPTLKFTATEKVHGTNGAVCYNEEAGFWVQSRSKIIDIGSDNADCAQHCYAKKEYWMEIIGKLASIHNINLKTHAIAVFFEWAGGNIQKNSCLSGHEKVAVIFEHFKVVEENGKSVWMPTSGIDNPEQGIYNATNLKTWEFLIDFNKHKEFYNSLVEMVQTEIEPASPIGKLFGYENNIGEGLVLTHLTEDGELLRFKVKGEKHAGPSGPKLKPMKEDDGKSLIKIEFANKACVNWRLEQGLNAIGGAKDTKQIGEFIRWVMDDIMKEESDLMLSQGLEKKDINGLVARVCREYFMTQLNASDFV